MYFNSAKVYYANTNLLLLFSNHVQTMPELNLSWVPTKPVQKIVSEVVFLYAKKSIYSIH